MFVAQGFQPKRSLEVMMFTSEEPTRFGLSCIGRWVGDCMGGRRGGGWMVGQQMIGGVDEREVGKGVGWVAGGWGTV